MSTVATGGVEHRYANLGASVTFHGVGNGVVVVVVVVVAAAAVIVVAVAG